MKYRTVNEHTDYQLGFRVNDLIEEGWVPLGAPFYVMEPHGIKPWYQAMIKDGEEEA